MLYFVTPEIGNSIETWALLVREAIVGGVGMVQVRDKTSSAKTIIEGIRLIQPFLKQASVPFLVNDRVDIALVTQADGVHVGQSDLSVCEARRILGNQAIIGLSIETLEQAKQAENQPLNYIAASPVFASATKRDCGPSWNLEGLTWLCSISSHPVVAIGGINLLNIQQVIECNVAAVAVVSAIAQAPCPRKAAQTLVKIYENAHVGRRRDCSSSTRTIFRNDKRQRSGRDWG